jgi:hypothetical protein
MNSDEAALGLDSEAGLEAAYSSEAGLEAAYSSEAAGVLPAADEL